MTLTEYFARCRAAVVRNQQKPPPATTCRCGYSNGGAFSVCPLCKEQMPLPEPIRTSLIVVLAFGCGVIVTSYLQDIKASGMSCFPDRYERVQ